MMTMPRVIPVLLLKDMGLVKTTKFTIPKYVGDPINAVRIFNNKEVDELIFLDITATSENKSPNFDLISRIASEAFMPFAYGGGVRSLEEATQILRMGAEKISINASACENPALVKEIADKHGIQSVIASIDVKKGRDNRYEIFTLNGTKAAGVDLVTYASKLERMGAGEILLNSIDNDGVMGGYDLELIASVSEAVSIPVIACGGAGKIEDFGEAVTAGASAVSAGSLFVFMGPHRAVLINYPDQEELFEIFHQSEISD